jgi:hypothetical protein
MFVVEKILYFLQNFKNNNNKKINLIKLNEIRLQSFECNPLMHSSIHSFGLLSKI